MELISKMSFNADVGKWFFSVKDKGKRMFVEMKGKETTICFMDEEPTTEGTKLLEKMKMSVEFQNILKPIYQWEEKMKHKLTLENVFIYNKEKRGEKEYYLFQFELKSKVATRNFVLEDGVDNILKTFTEYGKYKSEDFYYCFVLPLEKCVINNRIDFSYDEAYPLDVYMAYRKSSNSATKIFGRKNFRTHAGFLDDIIEKIKTDPTLRIKTLVM